MIIRPVLGLALALGLAPALAVAQAHGGVGEAGAASSYAELETRSIKSLSQADVEELSRGGGWGLALPAELNGAPGPAHLLELSDEIGLAPDQVAATQGVLAEMRAEAIAVGERLLDAERALDAAFLAGDLDDIRLRALVDAAEAARADLRFVHLSRHLSTPPLLTPDQVARYNVLRGYASDPCEDAPEGHDPETWRQHNGCG